jgi:hypothetical protein
MNDFLENLKREAADNPIAALGVAAGLLAAIGKLVNASTDAKKANDWKREVRRREVKDGIRRK